MQYINSSSAVRHQKVTTHQLRLHQRIKHTKLRSNHSSTSNEQNLVRHQLVALRHGSGSSSPPPESCSLPPNPASPLPSSPDKPGQKPQASKLERILPGVKRVHKDMQVSQKRIKSSRNGWLGRTGNRSKIFPQPYPSSTPFIIPLKAQVEERTVV